MESVLKRNAVIVFGLAMVFHQFFMFMKHNVAVRDVMKWAIPNKYKWYCSTALNYEPKFHLRHELYPLDLYVKHTSLIFNFILKRVLPFLEPVRYDAMLKRFPNYKDLHAKA